MLLETLEYLSGNNPKNSAGFQHDAMGATQIKEWFNRFKDGRMSADNQQHWETINEPKC
jgi:hypothetical protein